MMDSAASVRIQLQAGEDALAEFEEIRLGERSVLFPDAEGMAGEMVAFANADGGAVYLGVNDSGAAQGIPQDALTVVEEWVVNIATNNCDPPVRPVLRKVRIPDSKGVEVVVILVDIRKSLYVHRTTGGRYYVRVGSTKRDLTAQELARLFGRRGRSYVFDEQPILSAVEGDLDLSTMDRVFGKPPAIPKHDMLRNLRVLVADEDGVDRPTVAALVAFGNNPRDHLPSAYMDAAVYRGTRLSSDDLVHSTVMEGPVTYQVDEAVAFVDRFMLRPATKPMGREDHPQYPMGAVYEAIVNSSAHRDYSISGGKIRLFLFSDRLELYSPGGLPNTLTLETMPFRVFTRNQLLVSFLSKMKSRKTGQAYLESRGEGVRRILDEGERHSGRRPEYKLLGEELVLTLWAKPSPHGA
jgi:ATP-dependent DNA helicase RecG